MSKSNTATATLAKGPRLPENPIVAGHDRIARMAYAIWEREGRPEGQGLRHWALAEARCKSEPSAASRLFRRKG